MQTQRVLNFFEDHRSDCDSFFNNDLRTGSLPSHRIPELRIMSKPSGVTAYSFINQHGLPVTRCLHFK